MDTTDTTKNCSRVDDWVKAGEEYSWRLEDRLIVWGEEKRLYPYRRKAVCDCILDAKHVSSSSIMFLSDILH